MDLDDLLHSLDLDAARLPVDGDDRKTIDIIFAKLKIIVFNGLIEARRCDVLAHDLRLANDRIELLTRQLEEAEKEITELEEELQWKNT